MPEYTDQLGRTIRLDHPPRRIISTVPSQTELLFDLGLEDEVVGITKFCIHPEAMFRSKPRVGGTKSLKPEKIAALKPDLIIGNKEENERSQIEGLMQEYPVWMSDIVDLDGALDMINRLGALTDREDSARAIVSRIEAGFQELEANVPSSPPTPLKVAYLIWNDPIMVAGHTTFVDHLLTRCGWNNLFADRESRYPEVTKEELQDLQPDLLLLSSEPFPFAEKHLEGFQTLLPNSHVLLVDGELFSWYGSRLLQTTGYLAQLVKKYSKK